MSENFILDRVGEVVLALTESGLSWEPVKTAQDVSDYSSCLWFDDSVIESGIEFSHIYAVESMPWGLIHEPLLPNVRLPLFRELKMYRFVVHGCITCKNQKTPWRLVSFVFGHRNIKACKEWEAQIMASLAMQVGRPKNLLVFVHPFSGKGDGTKTWETISPIFSRAKVGTKVIITNRAGHASDIMTSLTNRELNNYDGVVAVGGDGFFNEILNGLLLSRHKAPYPPAPADCPNFDGAISSGSCNSADENINTSEDCRPLLQSPGASNFDTTVSREKDGLSDTDISNQDPEFLKPHERFTLGLIPSGSTDAIVICTTGVRDPVTSALQIVFGKRISLDIAQVVRWKTYPSSTESPSIHYASSFVGYGFYGDVIKESEIYRWMGPKRYDYAGTKVFLKHRSYEAEVAYLDVSNEVPSCSGVRLEVGIQNIWRKSRQSNEAICRANCPTCSKDSKLINYADNQWCRSKGRYLSVGAAIISCRNERAPDGLVADAHLADGFLDLVLIKDCPRAHYLWHLTQLARKGGDPLNFDFVEHHKTPAFTFASSSGDSVWNLDGELLQASHLSAQVFRGLIRIFANGPEV